MSVKAARSRDQALATKMGVGNQELRTSEAEEQTPLLREQRQGDGDDRSSETLTDGTKGGDDEEGEDLDKANQQVGKARAVLIIISIWGLIFFQAANMSGITTTQSKIAEDLDAFAQASWFTSSYLIAMSSTSPLVARLAQIFSPRLCVFGSSLFFALGGIVTSQAQRLGVFLVGRAIQGIGAAGVMTISFILVLELAGKKRRGLFIGLVNTGFTTGLSFGAVIAGALLPVTGWRFLFFIQTPLALIFGLGLLFSIPSTFTSGPSSVSSATVLQKLAKIDYLGALSLTSTLILFLFGLSFSRILWIPIAISLLLLLIFIYVELKVATDPIIPITVLRSRGALLSCLAQLLLMSSRWMILFYTPTYALAVRLWSPVSAGSIIIPTNIGFATGGIIVGAFHVKRSGSFWLPSIISPALFACTLTLLRLISVPETPTWCYLLVIFVNGLCTGAALTYTLAHLLHLTPPSTHFIGTSLLATFRGFAGSFGSAIGGGLFVRTLKRSLEEGFESNGGLEGREELVRRLLGGPALVKGLEGVERMVAMNSYRVALKKLFLVGVGIAIVVVGVQAATGWRKGEELETVEEERFGDNEEMSAEEEEWEEGMEQGA